MKVNGKILRFSAPEAAVERARQLQRSTRPGEPVPSLSAVLRRVFIAGLEQLAPVASDVSRAPREQA